MKKRILALVCASAMVMGMSLSVCAAGSVTAEQAAAAADAIKEVQAPADATVKVEENNIVVEIKDSAVKVEVPLSDGARTEAAAAATAAVVDLPATATIAPLAVADVPAIAKIAAAAAQVAVAEKATKVETKFVADITNTAGAATYKFNIAVAADQVAYALHYKADGTVEKIKCDVAGNSVSFTLTTYSPVAIVVVTEAPEADDDDDDAAPAATAATVAAPKTGDVSALMAIFAAVSATGAVALGKKRK